ncbi:MAG: response regulator transcription factor [Flavobacterium haoranii]|nr:response regulator transcription factor [Flavobacteriaceae bacterium]MDK2771333.1 response regulator transcription factor [Flavobacterium sp.]
MSKINIFMIDDHPMMIEGYKSILSYNSLDVEVDVVAAHNCKEAYDRINFTTNENAFDVVFLDLSLPAYEEKNINSGEDLAYLLRDKFPNTKIIILTSHAEAFLLYDLKKKVNPEGILVKSDFSAEELLNAFETILKGEIFESKTVRESVDEILQSKDKILLDETNREIIRLLAQGVLTKNMPQYINLGISAIDKRKAQIKDYFLIKGGSDEDIVRLSKKHGLI